MGVHWYKKTSYSVAKGNNYVIVDMTSIMRRIFNIISLYYRQCLHPQNSMVVVWPGNSSLNTNGTWNKVALRVSHLHISFSKLCPCESRTCRANRISTVMEANVIRLILIRPISLAAKYWIDKIINIILILLFFSSKNIYLSSIGNSLTDRTIIQFVWLKSRITIKSVLFEQDPSFFDSEKTMWFHVWSPQTLLSPHLFVLVI